MTQLTTGDLTRVLEAVAILNAGVDLESLPKRTLDSVSFLIPNEMTAYDGLDADGYYEGSLWYSPPGTVPSERVSLLGELIHEHPNFHRLISTPDTCIARMGEGMPLSKFHRTTLYNEFYRLFGGDDQLSAAMRLAPKSLITCSVHRPGLPFSNREYGMWNLVVPHLKAAFKNAQFVDQIDSHRRYLNQVVAKGVVVLNEEGKVTFESDLAKKMIDAYFSGRLHSGLPNKIRDFVAGQAGAFSSGEDFDPQRSLTVSNGWSELRITVAPDSQEREVLIFLEERLPHGVSDFENAGISRREAEILFWVSRGKTDPEIAALLSISPRTVHKHLEHIFTKLGVETRTAAVLQSLDFFA